MCFTYQIGVMLSFLPASGAGSWPKLAQVLVGK